MISLRDRSISRSNRLISRRDRLISRSNRLISRGDRLISSSNRLISRRDRSISRGDPRISHRDRAISRGNPSISARNQTIAIFNQRMKKCHSKMTLPSVRDRPHDRFDVMLRLELPQHDFDRRGTADRRRVVLPILQRRHRNAEGVRNLIAAASHANPARPELRPFHGRRDEQRPCRLPVARSRSHAVTQCLRATA